MSSCWRFTSSPAETQWAFSTTVQIPQESLLLLNIGGQLPFSPLFEHLQHKSCARWNCSLRQWLSWEIMFAIYTSTRAWVMQLWQTCLLISAPSSWRKNARGFVFSRLSAHSDDISGNNAFPDCNHIYSKQLNVSLVGMTNIYISAHYLCSTHAVIQRCRGRKHRLVFSQREKLLLVADNAATAWKAY